MEAPVCTAGDRKRQICNHEHVLKTKFEHKACLPDSMPQFQPAHTSFILVPTINSFIELQKDLAVMANASAPVSQNLQHCGPVDAENITAGTSWMGLSGQTCEHWKLFGLDLPHSQNLFRTSTEGFAWAGSIHTVLTRNMSTSHLGSNCLTHLMWIFLASRSWMSCLRAHRDLKMGRKRSYQAVASCPPTGH